MRLLLVVALVAGCEKGSHEVDPVSADEAQAFATQYAAAMLPCDEAKLADLIDGEAMAGKAEKSARSDAGRFSGMPLRNARSTAHFLCAGQAGTEGYRMLHTKTVAGDTRPVMRRLARSARKPVAIVGYDELQLGKSRDDHKVRLVDVYSYAQGAWLSETLSGFVDAVSSDGADGGFDAAHAITAARELQKQGAFGDALGKLDTLPAPVRRTRMVQLMRVRFGEQISQDAYKQALDELAKDYPDDPSLALMQVDGAFLRGDLDGALKNINLVDQAIGGDAFQDAIRAEVYLKRNQPGDLDRAAERAEAATRTEPTLAKGWWARLDAAVYRKDYAKAFETIEHLQQHFKATLDDATLHKVPSYAEFLASPEYATWRAAHP